MSELHKLFNKPIPRPLETDPRNHPLLNRVIQQANRRGAFPSPSGFDPFIAHYTWDTPLNLQGFVQTTHPDVMYTHKDARPWTTHHEFAHTQQSKRSPKESFFELPALTSMHTRSKLDKLGKILNKHKPLEDIKSVYTDGYPNWREFLADVHTLYTLHPQKAQKFISELDPQTANFIMQRVLPTHNSVVPDLQTALSRAKNKPSKLQALRQWIRNVTAY